MIHRAGARKRRRWRRYWLPSVPYNTHMVLAVPHNQQNLLVQLYSLYRYRVLLQVDFITIGSFFTHPMVNAEVEQDPYHKWLLGYLSWDCRISWCAGIFQRWAGGYPTPPHSRGTVTVFIMIHNCHALFLICWSVSAFLCQRTVLPRRSKLDRLRFKRQAQDKKNCVHKYKLKIKSWKKVHKTIQLFKRVPVLIFL